MIILYWKVCIGSSALIILFLVYCAFSAYNINAKRESDDPKKKDYAPLSPWLTPATPFVWFARMLILAPWSILFGMFLLTFPFILILFHPLPDDDPIQSAILKVGNGVLKINTWLLTALGLYAKPVRFKV